MGLKVGLEPMITIARYKQNYFLTLRSTVNISLKLSYLDNNYCEHLIQGQNVLCCYTLPGTRYGVNTYNLFYKYPIFNIVYAVVT